MCDLTNGLDRPCGDITILLASSPIPSHPSTRLISSVLSSLRFIKDLKKDTKVLIAQDGCDDSDVLPTYDRYLHKLERLLDRSPLNSRIVRNPIRGHLTGNIRNAIQFVDTKYVLMLQHDLPFVTEFEIYPVIEDMEATPSFKHIRFNRRSNVKAKWDAQSDLFGKQMQGKNCTYTRTGAWSDQNHLSTVDYYKTIVLSEVSDGTFMESVLNERSHRDHERYGTYIYGGVGHPAMIRHIRGRNSSRYAAKDQFAICCDLFGRGVRKISKGLRGT